MYLDSGWFFKLVLYFKIKINSFYAILIVVIENNVYIMKGSIVLIYIFCTAKVNVWNVMLKGMISVKLISYKYNKII